MTAFATSQRSKNAIEVCFGEALCAPRKFRAKMHDCSGRRDTIVYCEGRTILIAMGNLFTILYWPTLLIVIAIAYRTIESPGEQKRVEGCRSDKICVWWRRWWYYYKGYAVLKVHALEKSYDLALSPSIKGNLVILQWLLWGFDASRHHEGLESYQEGWIADERSGGCLVTDRDEKEKTNLVALGFKAILYWLLN